MKEVSQKLKEVSQKWKEVSQKWKEVSQKTQGSKSRRSRKVNVYKVQRGAGNHSYNILHQILHQHIRSIYTNILYKTEIPSGN